MRTGFALLLALVSLLALAGCGSISPNAESSPLTLPPGWQQLNLPLSADVPDGELIVAPRDGMSAYGCQVSNKAETIWSTHNGGKTWAKAAAFPDASSLDESTCDITIDAGDAQSLVVRVGYGFDAVFFSHDSGKTWTRFPEGFYIATPVTYQGATYATINTSDTTSPLFGAYPLAKSLDGWKTWTPLQPEGTPQVSYPINPVQLWMDPHNGSMLIRESDFWQSNDLGQTWSEIGAVPQPKNLQATTSEFIMPTPSGKDWAICSATAPTIDSPHTLCTYDSGKHWSTLPLPPLPDATVVAGLPSNMPTPSVSGMLLDAQNNFIIEVITVGAPAAYNGYYRFSPGATGWQKLTTPADAANLLYAPLPSPGVVWGLGLNNHTYIASYSALS